MKQTWQRPFRVSHRGGRSQDFDRFFLSDNPSRYNGWSGYLQARTRHRQV